MVWAQVLRRGSRSLALLVGLLIACAGFTVLTGQVRSSSLRTIGQIKVTRSAYDILVRPKGAQSALERENSLVQAGFLTQVHGGISIAQWHTIEKIPGVQVAAPVAVIGYVTPKVQVPVVTAEVIPPFTGRSLTRVSTTWRTDNGTSVVKGRPSYVYVTPNKLAFPDNQPQVVEVEHGHDQVIQRSIQTPPVTVRSGPTQAEFFTTSEFTDPARAKFVGNLVNPVVGFPFLVEAVDPVAEAKLAGLKSAVTSGSYLQSGPVKFKNVDRELFQVVPVLVASHPATHVSLSYQVDQLSAQTANAVGVGTGFSAADTAPGRVLRSGTVTQDQTYKLLLASMKSPNPTNYFARRLSYVYSTGGTSYDVQGQGAARRLIARTVTHPDGVWGNSNGDQFGSLIPAGGDDTAFRAMAGYQWSSGSDSGTKLDAPKFDAVGTFDASKLPGYSALSQVPLGTYASTVVTGATPKDRKVLGNKALPASPNIAGYVQPAPLMLTTLSALPVFEAGSGAYSALRADPSTTAPAPVNAAAPISSIRIRVAGVHGIDATSRARVRLAAQQIESKTGLSVDVTVGSSPAPQTVVLAAGQHGRPALSVHENWVKKGVALAIVSAINKKSLALFLLVLVVCALFVTNIAAASVRARRTELGVLACLGWTRTRLFGLVATELGLIALVAGVGGSLVAWGCGAALGIPITLARAAVSIPVALAVALVAGLLPAWRAAHAPPLEAVRSTATLPRRGAEPETVAGMAWVNVTRTRARSILAAAGLAVAVAALTVIVGILVAFRGAVVGTLLGSAVTVQVRGSDYAAVAAIIILAGIGVTNVLFLGIRERGAEIATLRAVGWTESTLTRLLVLEGLFLGISGSLIGAVIGIGVLVVFVSIPATTITLTVLIALGAGVLIAIAATLPATATLRTLPTALLLTEE